VLPGPRPWQQAAGQDQPLVRAPRGSEADPIRGSGWPGTGRCFCKGRLPAAAV